MSRREFNQEGAAGAHSLIAPIALASRPLVAPLRCGKADGAQGLIITWTELVVSLSLFLSNLSYLNP